MKIELPDNIKIELSLAEFRELFSERMPCLLSSSSHPHPDIPDLKSGQRSQDGDVERIREEACLPAQGIAKNIPCAPITKINKKIDFSHKIPHEIQEAVKQKIADFKCFQIKDLDIPSNYKISGNDYNYLIKYMRQLGIKSHRSSYMHRLGVMYWQVPSRIKADGTLEYALVPESFPNSLHTPPARVIPRINRELPHDDIINDVYGK